MLDAVVRYLHSSKVPFRLVSYPSDEPEPKVAHPLPPHALLVESRFVVVDGRLVLACCAAGDHVDLHAIGGELGGNAMDAAAEDLPDALIHAQGEATIPPVGQLFGVPLVIDDRVAQAAKVVFATFGSDFIEIAYEDFARQEQPLVASIVRAGELAAAPPPAGRRRQRPGQAG
jgi:prolyl-tRNA editing enzyme YbaK/EbsC (Cys-tRNA(Pro) deacylase)